MVENIIETDAGAILYEQILENLEDSYWNKDLERVNKTNRGYVLVDGKWYTFGWFIGWGILISTIKEMDHVPDISKAFCMKDSKNYKEYKEYRRRNP